MSFRKQDIIEYGIYNAIIDFDDIRGRSKPRPVILFRIVDGTINKFRVQVMSITSKRDPKGKERKKSRYEVDIRHWKEAGLDHESRVQVEKVTIIDNDNLISFRGVMLESDIIQVERKFIQMNEECYDTPWNFLNLLKREGVKDTIPKDGVNNNNNLIQSIEDIEDSKQANCVDVTLANHGICMNEGYKDKIVWVKWHLSETSTPGHLFSMFTRDQNKYYSLQWLGDKGEILGPDSSWEECRKNSIEYLTYNKPKYRHKRYTSYVFTNHDIEYINNIKEPITQKELLDHIETTAVFEQTIAKEDLNFVEIYNKLRS